MYSNFSLPPLIFLSPLSPATLLPTPSTPKSPCVAMPLPPPPPTTATSTPLLTTATYRRRPSTAGGASVPPPFGLLHLLISCSFKSGLEESSGASLRWRAATVSRRDQAMVGCDGGGSMECDGSGTGVHIMLRSSPPPTCPSPRFHEG